MTSFDGPFTQPPTVPQSQTVLFQLTIPGDLLFAIQALGDQGLTRCLPTNRPYSPHFFHIFLFFLYMPLNNFFQETGCTDTILAMNDSLGGLFQICQAKEICKILEHP